MALDFSLTSPQTLLGYQVPSQPITITLTGTGMLGSDAIFTPTGSGSSTPATVTIPMGSTVGATQTFTFTPTTQTSITVTSSGGLVASHVLSIPMAMPGTVTAQQLIDQGLGILGVRAVGETTSGTEANDVLGRLNAMIDLMRLSRPFATSVSRVTATLPGNTQAVTIGPSGTIVTPYRPVRIEQGSFFSVSVAGSGNYDYPIASGISASAYNDIGYKTIGTIGPETVYYEPGIPNGTLYFYPQATGPVTLTLMCLMEMTQFADLTTAYNLGPGYRQMLAYMIANEMQADYERSLSQAAMMNLKAAVRAVKRANMIVPDLMSARVPGNILTGWEN